MYRATDTKLGRDVALKVLPAEMAQDGDRLGRLRREAKALAQLDHTNIVTIHSVDSWLHRLPHCVASDLEQVSVNQNIWHDATDGAVGAGKVGLEIPAYREKQAQQLPKDHIQRRPVIIE